ncbi:MAG: DUF1579 family protein [Planctomycetota bacterium]|jgi:hypothetical protein
MRDLLLAALLAVIPACSTPAEPPSVTDAEMPPMPQPTAEHASILATAGHWTGTLTSFEAGDQPYTAEAVEERTPIGGFWLRSVLHLDFMGMPFHGEECIGFDPATGRFQGSWVDNTSSYRALTTGEQQPDGKTIRWRWMAPDWQTGELVDHWRDETFEGDAYTSTFYRRTADGQEIRIMVFEMRRQPPGASG